METHPPCNDMERGEFAEFLRSTRERRHITLAEIANETKIAPRLLLALERGDVKTWPGGMYRRALMRAYAESIGLDPNLALERFDRVFDENTVRAAAPTLQALQEKKARRPSWRLLIGICGSIALVVVAATLWRAGRAPARQLVSTAPAAPVAATPEPEDFAIPAATSGTASPEAVLTAQDENAEGRLVVLSDPPGARVMVDGIGWGETPLTIRYLPHGEKRVRLTKQGYVSREQIVRLNSERPEATLRLALQPRP